MGLLFSVVKLAVDEKTEQLLVGGIPKTADELLGWIKFDEFIKSVKDDTIIDINAQGYIYGEDKIFDATPQEIAYFMRRIKMNKNFVESRCRKAENEVFSFRNKYGGSG